MYWGISLVIYYQRRLNMRLTRIHQLEISSTCNLRCKYCPYPKMQREKTYMGDDVLEKSLEWISYFCRFGRQDELALTGMGEAILHPNFENIAKRCRETVGDKAITMSTNGVAFNEHEAMVCKEYNVRVFVSAHRPEKAGIAVELAKRFGVFEALNGAPMLSAFDWAGQVDWHVTAPKQVCEYVSRGWGVILTNGDISSCCLDAEGQQIIGNVFKDKPEMVDNQGGALCATCHMTIPDTEEENC